MTSSDKITIFTDGACKGNPGRGGWAAVLIINGVKHIESGRESHTTNNRMELMAAIKGLEAAPPGKEVIIYSDSAYLVNTMTRNWKRNANHDLWERLDHYVKNGRSTGNGCGATTARRATRWPTESPAGKLDFSREPQPMTMQSHHARRKARPGY
jgi:ribonuclease HI